MHLNRFQEVPGNDHIGDSLGDDEAILDLSAEANQFIQFPSFSNAFYPHVCKSQIRRLIKPGVSQFKIELRRNIECEMDREDNLHIFDASSRRSSAFADPFNSILQNENQCTPSTSAKIACPNTTEVDAPRENPKTRQILIADIEALTIRILRDITTEGSVKLQIPCSKKWNNLKIENGMLTADRLSGVVNKIVNFKYLKCRHHMALIMYILSEVYHLLITNTTCTERKLYYDNPELCESQLKVKSAIKDVCCILKVSPWELGIRPSPKGLIAGALRIHMVDNVVVDCYMYDGASLIPDVQSIRLIETTAKFVLIVEKHTVFESLLKQNILLDINSDIMLITGKGYPDLNTRLFIKRVWEEFHLPMYALVDADPFGVEIMMVYRFGSRVMASNSDQLACPRIRWIGIHPSEIETLAIPSRPLSKRDQKKISELLLRSYVTGPIRNELETLRRLNCKAEIEGVTRFSTNFLVFDYIPTKIKRTLVL